MRVFLHAMKFHSCQRKKGLLYDYGYNYNILSLLAGIRRVSKTFRKYSLIIRIKINGTRDELLARVFGPKTESRRLLFFTPTTLSGHCSLSLCDRGRVSAKLLCETSLEGNVDISKGFSWRTHYGQKLLNP